MEPKEETKDDEEKDVPKMEGYLEKKGKSRLVSSWRRYWFVLEGRRLTYYESQPRPSVELPPSCKGSLTIAPATAVTASKQASSNDSGHQPSYLEIYILNSSRLVALRTKDADQHTSWVKALVASTNLPVKSPPANGSKSPKSAGTTSVFPLRPSTKYFRYSLTNLSSQEEKKAHWPKNVAHTMDSRSCSLYQRKSGSMDDILDRYADQAKESGKEANISDSEEEDNEDLKIKAVLPESEDHLILQSPLEYSLPAIEHELPTARLCEDKEKDLVQKKERMEELSALGIEDWDKIHPSSYADENYEAENDLSMYIEIKGTQSVKQGEIHEGKVKTRRFLTSLVSKDSKKFEGIHKQEKAPKKERQLAASDRKGAITQSVLDKNEKPKVKHTQTLKHLEVKEGQNDLQRVHKAISLNEASHIGSSVRNSIMKKTSEFRTARRGKRNKDKKKSENDEVESKDSPHEPSFSRQNSRKDKVLTDTPLLEESDTKKKRKKMSFLTKMLRGKKSDGQEDVAERYEILEDLPFDNVDSSDKFYSVHNTEDESSPQPYSTTVPPHLSFGLKLFPGDDAELKRKLESRMARIESEMAMTSENGKLPGLATPGIIDASSTPSTEGAGQTDANMKDIEETISSPPPVLPPRIIKLTPPTPPARQGDENLGDRSPDLLEGFLQGIASKDLSSSIYSSESNRRGEINDGIVLCERGESGWRGESQNDSKLGCVQSAVTIPESASSLTSNDKSGEERYGSEFESGICRIAMKVRDVRLHANYGTVDAGGAGTSPRMSWESCRDQNVGVNAPSSSDSVSCAQQVHSSFLQPFERSGGQVDELSLLLTELDRINSSPLHQDVSKPNHRPVSDEVKKVSTFAEDYITAFPIRRRRNSDPDYDIPRPHRIPHLQETKEESQVSMPSSSTQESENKPSNRENTDSIVIEATRFFGPGMDFSFNDKKYSSMRNNEDLWYYPYEAKNQELNFTSADYLYSGDCEGTLQSKSGSEFLAKTVKEPSEPNFSQINTNEGVSGTDEPKTVDQQNDCVLRSRNRLDITEDGEDDRVVMRSSSIDRACRKERSREIYEADLADQFKLNDLLEGLSISSTLASSEFENGEGSNEQTLADLDLPTNECFTLGLLDQEVSSKSSHEFCNVEAAEIPELNNPNVTLPNGPPSGKAEGLDTPPDAMTASAKEEGTGHENHLDDQENEVVLRSKPEGYSRDDSKAYRLSFATTETLLVEEEVLVATLKTTTTTTTLLPLEDGGIHGSRENVEEFVEEIVLDIDQLSDGQFDSMQVQSCVQT